MTFPKQCCLFGKVRAIRFPKIRLRISCKIFLSTAAAAAAAAGGVVSDGRPSILTRAAAAATAPVFLDFFDCAVQRSLVVEARFREACKSSFMERVDTIVSLSLLFESDLCDEEKPNASSLCFVVFALGFSFVLSLWILGP